jgi:chromosome segregation ATPase
MTALLEKVGLKRLPALPAPIHEHRDWIAFTTKRDALVATADETEAAVKVAEDQLATLREELREAAIAEVLAEDPAAARTAATLRTRMADTERELEDLRRRLAPQREAATRFAARGEALQARIAEEQRTAIEGLHRELTAALAKGLEGLAPINRQLLALRRTYPSATATMPFLNVLSPHVGPAGPNHIGQWVRDIQALGIRCELE